MSRLRFDQYLSAALLLGGALLWPGLAYQGEAQALPLPVVSEPILSWRPSIAAKPVWHSDRPQPTAEAALGSTISATAVYAMDVPSAAVLFAKQPDELRYPASTTKLMTALVASKTFDPHRVLQVRDEQYTSGTTMGLKIGEELTVESLLKGMLIGSANDAALVLANNHPGGYSGFTQEMNSMAEELGVSTATFINPSGLDDVSQQISARDLSILAREVMLDPVLRQIVGTREETLHDITGRYSHPTVSTNAFLGAVPGVIGVKTGTTLFAGQTLITYIELPERQILIVVMGSQDRYTDTKQILDWITAHYEWQPVAEPTVPEVH